MVVPAADPCSMQSNLAREAGSGTKLKANIINKIGNGLGQMSIRNKFKYFAVLLSLIILLPGAVHAQQQGILMQEVTGADGLRRVKVLYSVSNSEPTTGIGFGIYFDSSKVRVINIDLKLTLSSLGFQILPDTDNNDDDPATDLLINAAWVDLNGEWPSSGEVAVTELYTFSFDALPVELTGLFKIRDSASSAGYDFVSVIDSQ